MARRCKKTGRFIKDKWYHRLFKVIKWIFK